MSERREEGDVMLKSPGRITDTAAMWVSANYNDT